MPNKNPAKKSNDDHSVFFTSDLHFGHSNVMKYHPPFRDFSSVDEMDRRLINLWNNTVGIHDEVYNLGDLSFHKGIEKNIAIFEKLNGRHTLILGNHDHLIRENKDELLKIKKRDGHKLFEEITDYKELSLKYQNDTYRFVLFHYPIFEWNRGHHGSILLYGHVHDRLANIKGRALNVGYDLHGKILRLGDAISYTKDLEPCKHYGEDWLTLPQGNVADREWAIKEILKGIHAR